MADIKSKTLLIAKGGLFLVLGGIASALILFDHPELRTAVLLAVAVWAFCRAYYFAFYVVEHYIDANYRFAGLGSVVAFLWQSRRPRKTSPSETK
jgi:hypothetical protein